MNGTDVVMVTWNHAPSLRAALAGLSAQSDHLASVTVVDNNSLDDSAGIVRDWSARLPLRLVEMGENSGFARAANAGIRAGSAPWVLSLNPDCRLEPGFLSCLVKAATRHGAGHACGLLLRTEGTDLAAGNMVDSAGMVVTWSGRHHDRGTGAPILERFLQPAWVFGASGACALYRREALDDVAYARGEVFDEGFFAYREDADLSWRLQRRGWRCLYWPTARGVHQRGLRPEARRRGSSEVNRHSVRNRFLLRWANADWRWYLRCFPSWWLRDLAVIGACLTVERSSLSGLTEAFRRRSAQRRRGKANLLRSRVSGWEVARWFSLSGRVEEL